MPSLAGSVSPRLWALMSKPSILLGVVACVVVAVRQVKSWYRLRHIPGPPLAPFSVFWQLKNAVSGQYHEHLRKVAEDYGPLARIGPNELLCTDPETLRRIAGVRSRHTKGDFYDSGRVVPGVDNVVSIRDEDKHKAMRAKMAPAYVANSSAGYGFEAGIDRQLANLINLIDTEYVSTGPDFRPLDFAEKAQFFALDAIGDVSFGGAFGYLREDRDLFSYIQINDSSLPVMNVVSVLPWLARLVHRWPLRLVLPKENDQVGFGRLMGFAKGFVDQRLAPGAEPKNDMMQAFIDGGLDREELIQLTYIHMIAGSNSSAHAIRMTLLCLLTNPLAYRRLQEEIGEAVGTNAIRGPGLITNAEALKLPYLQAVIREGLRVHPPVTGLGYKQVPPEGDTINGMFIPGGTQIGHNFYGIGRSERVWGEDAQVFRPERWLEADGQRLVDMNAAVDLCFGHGKYGCLGKPIAMMELNKVFFELLRRFDFALINPQNPIKTSSAVFWIASDFWLRVTRRGSRFVPEELSLP